MTGFSIGIVNQLRINRMRSELGKTVGRRTYNKRTIVNNRSMLLILIYKWRDEHPSEQVNSIDLLINMDRSYRF